MRLYMFRTVFPSIIRSSRLYIQPYVFDKCLLLYVQFWTPDDGRKDRPKHVECHSKIRQIWYIGASCWVSYRNNMTMHGPTNVTMWSAHSPRHWAESLSTAIPLPASKLSCLLWPTDLIICLKYKSVFVLRVTLYICVYLDTYVCTLPWAGEKKWANRFTCLILYQFLARLYILEAMKSF